MHVLWICLIESNKNMRKSWRNASNAINITKEKKRIHSIDRNVRIEWCRCRYVLEEKTRTNLQRKIVVFASSIPLNCIWFCAYVNCAPNALCNFMKFFIGWPKKTEKIRLNQKQIYFIMFCESSEWKMLCVKHWQYNLKRWFTLCTLHTSHWRVFFLPSRDALMQQFLAHINTFQYSQYYFLDEFILLFLSSTREKKVYGDYVFPICRFTLCEHFLLLLLLLLPHHLLLLFRLLYVV